MDELLSPDIAKEGKGGDEGRAKKKKKNHGRKVVWKGRFCLVCVCVCVCV